MSAPDLSGITGNFLTSAQKGFTDTLSASISDVDTTIAMNSLAGFTDGDWVFMWIEPGVANAELVYGQVDSATNSLTSAVRGVLGTAAVHANGASVGSFISSAHWMLLKKMLEIEHNDDGTHKALTADSLNASGNITSGDTVTTPTLAVTGHATFNDGGILGNIRAYASSSTWTKPTGIKFVVVEVVGGGGAGGHTPATDGSHMAVGSGGGGGGYCLAKIAAASLSASETVTVGAGGTASTSTETSGGSSSFGSHCTGSGGANGASSGQLEMSGGHYIYGGAGGAASGGDINLPGSDGGMAGTYTQTNNVCYGGVGGSTHLGGSTNAAIANANGGAGKNYGGGGSGAAVSVSQSARPGGAGAGGVVIVYEYF